jgi:hypothetical protein
LNRPIAGRATAVPPSGYVSNTRPSVISSQDSQVFHGVRPPAQLLVVPDRIRRAPVTRPSAAKLIIEAPPPEDADVSALDT